MWYNSITMIETKEEEIKEEDKPIPVKVTLTKDQEVLIFKALAHKSFKEVGHDFGIHLMYPGDDLKVTQFVSHLSKRIRKAPAIWGISEDLVGVVQEALDKRSIRKNPQMRSELALQEESFRDKLDNMRDTVAEIIQRKLKKYNTVKGAETVQLRDLKDMLGMVIDKGRLLRGESTENIKKLSPLDLKDVTPEDALKIIMKARDVLIEGKK